MHCEASSGAHHDEQTSQIIHGKTAVISCQLTKHQFASFDIGKSTVKTHDNAREDFTARL